MYPNPVYGSGFYLQYKGAASAGMTVGSCRPEGQVMLEPEDEPVGKWGLPGTVQCETEGWRLSGNC